MHSCLRTINLTFDPSDVNKFALTYVASGKVRQTYLLVRFQPSFRLLPVW
jgi:hypothetical protein